MSISFCHISPTKYIKRYVSNYKCHLLLAHLIEDGNEYVQAYRSVNGFKIMDNSAYELHRQGKPMFDPSRLIEKARHVNANMIVLPDYPGEPAAKTINAAAEMIPKFKQAGFLTMFCPQSEPGHLEEYIAAVAWGVNHPDIDRTALSILSVPNAFNITQDNLLQRYLARRHMMKILMERKVLHGKQNCLHFLGMLDGPGEIELVKQWEPYIATWDSSSAIWHGINGITYDDSPTGLLDGKLETEVAFDAALKVSSTINIDQCIKDNLRTIDRMCE